MNRFCEFYVRVAFGSMYVIKIIIYYLFKFSKKYISKKSAILWLSKTVLILKSCPELSELSAFDFV
jgi:hypothetical protein